MVTKIRVSAAVRLPLVVAGVLWLSLPAAQSISSPPAETTQPPKAVLLAQLEDPQQREKLRAGARERVVAEHPDLTELVGLDASTQQRLIEFLADHALSTQQHVLKSFSAGPSGNSRGFSTQDSVDQYTRARGAISEMLGAASFGRYLDYIHTVHQRSMVEAFNRRLAADALSRQQRESMIELLAGHKHERGLVTENPFGNDRRQFLDLINKEAGEAEMARYHTLLSVKVNERSLARAHESSAQVLQASARILTESQQRVFAALEAERLEAHREQIRTLRKNAGLDPDAPIAPAPPPATELPSRLHWSVSITINDNAPKVVTFVGDVGQAVSFEVDERLSMEAIPSAGASSAGASILHLDMKLYETLSDGRHVIGDLYGSARLQASPNPDWTQSQIGTVLAGSRGYSVTFSLTGTAL